MRGKSYGLISTSQCSTASPSGFGKDNLCPYVGEHVCDKNQNFTINTPDVAMVHWEFVDYGSGGWLLETSSQ